MEKLILAVIIISIVLVGAFWYKFLPIDNRKTANARISILATPKVTLTPSLNIQILAENLDTPWGMVFLPDGSMLVTERAGRVRIVDKDGKLKENPAASIVLSKEIGEGGLLGIDIHPKFLKNNFVYLYYTFQGENNKTLNRVVRMLYDEEKLLNEEIIIDNIPGSFNHNGGRIKFGPDGYLYVATGDAEDPSQSQNTDSLAGKILRVDDKGLAAPGNLLGGQVYSYGHRNVQGLAWDKKGRLWSTEHGRSGALSGFDEINLIENGKNYGWPTIQGDEKFENMEVSRLNSGPYDTWAPAGATFYEDSLFYAGLRAQTLFEIKFDEDKMTLVEHLTHEYGRIRDVVVGPDNMLYFLTSNKDGRGTPSATDDRIIKINPSIFKRK